MERCKSSPHGYLSPKSRAPTGKPKGSHPSRSHISLREKSYRALGCKPGDSNKKPRPERPRLPDWDGSGETIPR